MLKVLFCGLKYEYGRPQWGLSFEFRNFYEVLSRMAGVEAEGFFVDEKMFEIGRDELNARLIYEVEEKKPDLLFCFLFTEELKKETISYITRKTRTQTFNWFADDHWRFPIYSKYWAPMFSAVSTTDAQAVAKYQALGVKVIKTQWAANTYVYKPVSRLISSPNKEDGGTGRETYQIVFVGKNYGNRQHYINSLKSQGLPAEGYGSGWPKGRVSQQRMLEIFSNARINLNFTESPYTNFSGNLKFISNFFLERQSFLGGWNFKCPISDFKFYYQAFRGAQRNQIKGRTFEIPACGGFLLSQSAEDLSDYYQDGREIVIFHSESDMIEKCKYYLEHEQERQAIAQSGYARTVKEHTYELRFREIFQAMGLM